VDNPKQLPTVLSLCSGYGGIERGLDLAGVEHRVLAHVEIEAFAIANLVSKMEDRIIPPAPIWSNLKTLPVEPFRNRVEILTSGYPCQPFSAAGKRAGKEDPRHLWPYIVDIIRAVRPIRCFFENVEGHISLGLREVIADLESLGYSTAWGIFSAREVGAPHQRKRVYIMADTISEGSQGSQRLGKARAKRFSKGHTAECNNQLADTISTRSETGLSGSERPKQEGNAGITDNRDSEQGGWQIGMHWPPEPGLGRVVDGCADRVDRIRLLGNGVVPATAAKAWRVLNG